MTISSRTSIGRAEPCLFSSCGPPLRAGVASESATAEYSARYCGVFRPILRSSVSAPSRFFGFKGKQSLTCDADTFCRSSSVRSYKMSPTRQGHRLEPCPRFGTHKGTKSDFRVVTKIEGYPSRSLSASLVYRRRTVPLETQMPTAFHWPTMMQRRLARVTAV